MGSRRITLALFCVIFLVSCGTEDSNLAEGGSTGTGISNGSITAIGSVSVNGVKFDTSDARIIVEGDDVGVGDLAVLAHLATGQVVTVEGEINGTSGTALRVRFKGKVRGPVTDVIDVDANTKRLVVLDQTVIIDDNTGYQDTSFNAVAFDNFVEVSGLTDELGVIQATHLKNKADVFDRNQEVKVKGTISKLDVVPQTFQINALTVDYSSTNALPRGGLANDQFAEVRGLLDTKDVLMATKVELEDDIGVDNADRIEVEGFVTAPDLNPLNPVKAFTVGTQPVMTTAGTRYEAGESFEIALGAKLEVEGALVDRVLIADEVSFRDNAKLKSVVAMRDSSGSSAGTLTLQGLGLDDITVIVNELTKIIGDAQSFTDIEVGDHVDVRGRTSTGTPTVTVIAREIKVKNFNPNIPNLEVELQGPVDEKKPISDPYIIVILGIDIDTRPVGEFEGIDDTQMLTREQFFDMVMAGDVVEASGHLQDRASRIVDWTEVGLEDDD
jgi:hypothetical protein